MADMQIGSLLKSVVYQQSGDFCYKMKQMFCFNRQRHLFVVKSIYKVNTIK